MGQPGQLAAGFGGACCRTPIVWASLELQSDSSVARFGLANVDLLEGRWAQGWQNYELRWMGSQQAGRRVVRPNLPWPQWLGQAPIPGQSIFVFHEQGFGDTLHFMRFLPLLAQQFGRVVFVCQPSLVRVRRVPAWATALKLCRPTRESSSLKTAGLTGRCRCCRCHWLWVWLHPPFGQANAFTGSYLRVPAADPAAPLQVGLCWAGNSEHSADALRSVSLAHFDSLFKLPGVQWHALVHGAGCPDPRLHDALHGAQDFADTAQRVRAWTWSSAWTRPWPTWPPAWADRSGCSTGLRRTGVGASRVSIASGTPACANFANRPRANGNRYCRRLNRHCATGKRSNRFNCRFCSYQLHA